MSKRAVRKKLSKKFVVGDIVTWGSKNIAHRVAQVDRVGVWVDSTSTGFGTKQKDKTLRLFVPFVPVSTGCGGLTGPPEHTTMKPDVLRK